MTKEYIGICWDTEDLISCKQAACMLWRKGLELEELEELDFGSLDIQAAIREEE